MAKTRSPICSCLGHVDHGKSSILDKIRNTAIVESEPGRITQAIGASIIPLDAIKRVCGGLLESLHMDFTIPGILAIDTPGHAAFTTLRKRGGSISDIAILVVDINEGLKPQTEEAIEILKTYKTPFIVAANKIDLIAGWKKQNDILLKNMEEQDIKTIGIFEQKMYQLVEQLQQKFEIKSDRFDRVSDFTKQVAIVPVSAITGEGIPELLMVLAGLAQKYLEQCLECNVEGPAKGTILEVKEEKGLGKTIDVIIYDGTLKVNDTIVIGGIDQPIVTKVRALFEPKALIDMKDIKSKFSSVKDVSAATGVKISAPELEGVIAGMPLRSCGARDVEKAKEEIMKEIEETRIETEQEGIIVKADTIGSLEAIIKLFREKGIAIRRADIGDVTKKDISDAESNYEKYPLLAVILGFNIKSDIPIPGNVKLITSDIIYTLIGDFEKWQEEQRKRIEEKELEGITRPCKIELMKGYVFRQNNPAVVGVNVLGGTVKTDTDLMNLQGRQLTTVKSIQKENENIKEAKKNDQVAVSLPGVTVGRQIKEGDVLISAISEGDFRKLKEYKHLLSNEEKELLKEIAEIMRRNNATWGV
ncbi:translation initiation factor IF-2 [Candidatus Woesearchaeota archaeon]|nr:translation initiation factor IF-2 [Candidatus Woesearchaeota archaeon]